MGYAYIDVGFGRGGVKEEAGVEIQEVPVADGDSHGFPGGVCLDP